MCKEMLSCKCDYVIMELTVLYRIKNGIPDNVSPPTSRCPLI